VSEEAAVETQLQSIYTVVVSGSSSSSSSVVIDRGPLLSVSLSLASLMSPVSLVSQQSKVVVVRGRQQSVCKEGVIVSGPSPSSSFSDKISRASAWGHLHQQAVVVRERQQSVCKGGVIVSGPSLSSSSFSDKGSRASTGVGVIVSRPSPSSSFSNKGNRAARLSSYKKGSRAFERGASLPAGRRRRRRSSIKEAEPRGSRRTRRAAERLQGGRHRQQAVAVVVVQQ
jgi:hypothetical protein